MLRFARILIYPVFTSLSFFFFLSCSPLLYEPTSPEIVQAR